MINTLTNDEVDVIINAINMFEHFGIIDKVPEERIIIHNDRGMIIILNRKDIRI